MTVEEIVARLKKMGSEGTARVLRNHGAHDPCLGVKIGDMKPLQKQLKKNYSLSMELYDTGIYDAMYLAGLIAEPELMTKKDLTGWVKTASKPIASYVIGPTAASSPAGWNIALAWIKSKKEIENIAGWATLSAAASIYPDDELDLDEYQRLPFCASRANSLPSQARNRKQSFEPGWQPKASLPTTPSNPAAWKLRDTIHLLLQVRCVATKF